MLGGRFCGHSVYVNISNFCFFLFLLIYSNKKHQQIIPQIDAAEMWLSRDTKLSAVIPVVIAAKNDSDDVLSNIMDVSFHRRYHQCSNVCTVLS